MMKSFAAFVFAGLQASWGQSISSCGNPGDHASNVKLSLSPDPIQKGQPFSITVGADLDEDITAGTFVINFTCKVLGQDCGTTSSTSDFTLSDGIVGKGTGLQAKIGPVKIPGLAGNFEGAGKIEIMNAKKEPVACVNLDIKIPLLNEETKLDKPKMEELDPVPGLTICSKPDDHITNLTIDQGSDSTVTITGTNDVDLQRFTVNAGLAIKVPVVPAVKLNFPIPVELIGAKIPQGALKITSTPKDDKNTPNGLVSVSGQVTAIDTVSKEIFCLQFGDTAKKIVV